MLLLKLRPAPTTGQAPAVGEGVPRPAFRSALARPRRTLSMALVSTVALEGEAPEPDALMLEINGFLLEINGHTLEIS